MNTNELTLARELLTNEVMALRYVDVLAEGPSPFEDNSPLADDLRLEEWAAARGHSISRSLMPEAFEQLPKRRLDYWFGTYLLTDAAHPNSTDDAGVAKVYTLMISVHGDVSLNGIDVVNVRFHEGTLAWQESSELPAGLVTFEELVPPEVDFFQKKCRGRFSWKKGEVEDVIGTTVAVAAVTANATTPTPFDASTWKGSYSIASGGFLIVGEASDDGHVAVTYQADYAVDVNSQPLPTSSSALSWDSGNTRFQLFFSKLGSGYKAVTGRVYAIGSPVPDAPTFFATEEGWTNRLSPAAIATMAISATTGGVAVLAGVIAFVLNLISRKDAALNQKRKLYASEVNRQVDPNVLRLLDAEVQRARKLLSDVAVRFNIEAKTMAKFEPALAVLIRKPDPTLQAARVSERLLSEHDQLTRENNALGKLKRELRVLAERLTTDQATADRLRRELPQRLDPIEAKAQYDQHIARLAETKRQHHKRLEEVRIRANDVLARTERVNSIAKEINHGPT